MRILGLLIACVAVVGCGPGDSAKATEEDKAALKKLATEGIGTKPAGAADPAPVNGQVAPP